jgi:hypothetical protein
MASKYLSSGTASYISATRTISGAAMNADFATSDVSKSVVFFATSVVYWGYVKTFVSATDVILEANGSLPATDDTIDVLFVLDQGQSHTFTDYLNQIKTLIQDDVAKLTEAEISRLLFGAVSDWGDDAQLTGVFRVTGDGTSSYVLAVALGSYWRYGETVVCGVEYPQGDVPPSYLDPDEFYVYDDGSAQDGSNVALVFASAKPSASETFAIRARYDPTLDAVAGQNFPDTPANFNNISMLAASYCCFALASAYALSTDSTVSGDAINYGDKTHKYIRLGREFLKRYNQSVFGAEEPKSSVAAATVTMELERRASDRGSLLFH